MRIDHGHVSIMKSIGLGSPESLVKRFLKSKGGTLTHPLLLAPFAAAAGCSLLLLVDPATGVYPPCPSHVVFGLDCPACGGLRATSALLRGDVSSFLDHNVLLAVIFPLLVAVWVGGVWRKINPQSRLTLTRASIRTIWWGVALVVVLFTVSRNIFPYMGSGIG
jgi:Protein of unknown function (DUF2752)